MKRNSGVSLLEILTVLVIIALLIALILPLINTSRERARVTQCFSNMRQLAAALTAYRQDYGEFPPFVQYVFPYAKSREVFLCPRDYLRDYGGANWFGGGNTYANRHGIKLSYFYFADPVGRFEQLRHLLPERDPNHGLLACLLHGDCKPYCRGTTPPAAVEFCCEGLTLRVRLDGSVQRAKTYLRPCTDPADNQAGYVRDRWNLFTDVPCPPEVCRRNCH
ncbi:MAG: hypothetical protein KatS3mg016_0769 [Fimbriimonadales bacterium]|nr:MAG: hypothetical protein KatS3mg016_0769 [Fimbriimonadales bacterium]